MIAPTADRVPGAIMSGVSLPISHRIVTATPADLSEVSELLHTTGLSAEGLDGFVDTLLVSRSRGRIIGCAGLEIRGASALLRSVAVDVGWQGRGLGTELVKKAMLLAQARGVRELFLLTESADEYFAHLGFARCARGDAPEAIRATLEYASLCPASAIAMRRDIDPPRPAVRTPRA
ncbi:MAG TPA: arsenic resistance N-acetyltransferase ArsN2 [Candidatus Krumholzibacteria bacterium]|nr:arsenic resistance N-acetyltransferase ArsN2 [Candidatus Krumholzibacteria bacterium]